MQQQSSAHVLASSKLMYSDKKTVHHIVCPWNWVYKLVDTCSVQSIHSCPFNLFYTGSGKTRWTRMATWTSIVAPHCSTKIWALFVKKSLRSWFGPTTLFCQSWVKSGVWCLTWLHSKPTQGGGLWGCGAFMYGYRWWQCRHRCPNLPPGGLASGWRPWLQ